MEVLNPADCQRLVSSLRDAGTQLWVYRFTHPDAGWILSIATHAEPGSQKLSLGGFRIAPRERTDSPRFDADKEAINLAVGMEQKTRWSRVLNVGGPRGRKNISRIVGGKCVLQPTDDARVGKPRDFELLDWSLACFAEMERESGVSLTTGQDLGHGLMSDGQTQSLDYLAERFRGCVAADTAIPTAEGNYYVLRGMLAAVGIQVAKATIGLIGVGNVGGHVCKRIHEEGGSVLAVEANPEKRETIERAGARVWDLAGKAEMIREPMDALVVNASGGSLDEPTIVACVGNPRLKLLCGSENLAMPVPDGARRLLAARKIYCPTELGGMMGYLTAVEEYLTRQEGLRFEIRTILESAKRLEIVARQGTALIRSSDYAIDFEAAAEEVGRQGRGIPSV